MNFVSTEQLYRDVVAWEKQLPYFDAVCGIPRSGLFPASYIAMRRNIRLVEYSELFANPATAIQQAKIRDLNPIIYYKKPVGNRLLIVDDSASPSSVTISGIKDQLKDQTALDISYGVVYRASAKSQVDFYYREVPFPRMFGWNWYRHWGLQFALCDMDGVLCEDWKHRPELNDDEEFVDHLSNAKPLYIPDTPILGVVTSRLVRYKELTEAWLKKHGVKYQALYMHPAKTPEERRAMRDHAERKADVYNKITVANLFVESDTKQAGRIFELTRKPVLCIDNMTCLS
jgi:uncharacterized HAD superfamily protein